MPVPDKPREPTPTPTPPPEPNPDDGSVIGGDIGDIGDIEIGGQVGGCPIDETANLGG